MFHIRNNHTSVRLIDRSQTGAYSNVTCSPVYVGVTLFSKPLTCLKHVPLRFKRPRSSQSGFKVCHIVTDVCRNHDSMGISSPTESALYACCRFGRGLYERNSFRGEVSLSFQTCIPNKRLPLTVGEKPLYQIIPPLSILHL